MARKGELPEPCAGALLKVWLPGETPWVVVVTVNDDGTFIGRIDSGLVNTKEHGLSSGNEVKFRADTSHREFDLWVVDRRHTDRRHHDRRANP